MYNGDSNFKTTSNTAPTVGLISAPPTPQPITTVINVNATFVDPVGLPKTAVFNYGDGTNSSVPVTTSSGTVSGTHTYATDDVYTISLAVTDPNGGVGLSIYQFVVIYNPNAGFVTGGGWINSPLGAYAANPSLTGKANFGFNSGYKPGRSVPDGQTEFQFDVGNLEFHSTAYDWLTIINNLAQYQGTGVINGAGNYKFVLTSVDGDAAGGTGFDTFRIRIWDPSSNPQRQWQQLRV